jgi:hypothetical protein
MCSRTTYAHPLFLIEEVVDLGHVRCAPIGQVLLGLEFREKRREAIELDKEAWD